MEKFASFTQPRTITHSFTSIPINTSIDTPPFATSLPVSSLKQNSNFSFASYVHTIKSLESVKVVHAQMIKRSTDWKSDSLAKNLISYYLKYGDSRLAVIVFFVGFLRNYSEWNYFVEEVKSSGGELWDILGVFKQLHSKGIVFDSKVLTVVLKLCTVAMDMWLGLEIQSLLIKRGFDLDVYVRSALMNFYGGYGDTDTANKVFSERPFEEDMLWNEAITANLESRNLTKALELFRDMQFSNAVASGGTIVKVLQACGKVRALKEGMQIHGHVLKCALESNLFIFNSLISMYSKNGRLLQAQKVFDSMKNRNISSWNSIMSVHATLGSLQDAWGLVDRMESSVVEPDVITYNILLSGHIVQGSCKYVLSILQRMQNAGLRPNSSSISSVLQAITELGLLNFGKEIHGYVIRNGLDYDVYVGTSLVDMYVKNNCLTRARAVFENIQNRNVFSWNSLISGCSFKGLMKDTESLVNQMQNEGIEPDLVTWNSLITGYSMWGRGQEALNVITQIKSSGLTPNVVSWTALLSGCSQNGNYREVLRLFIQMQEEKVEPNSTTMAILLRACAGLSLLQSGKEIHCVSIRRGFMEDAFIATALIDMYSKSGNLGTAVRIFRKIKDKTLPSWNSMMMGYAIYGLGKQTISLFQEMCEAGIQPDAITFTAILSGCKNSGLVDEGWKYFDSMGSDYNITPTIEHYSCMVDLLGRAGYLDEAWDFIHSIPLEPDATIWGAFLGSCRIHRSIRFAEVAAKKLFELEPYNPANYLLLMNLYAILNRWEDVEQVKDLMHTRGVKNGYVWSWLQIDQTIHEFLEGKTHPEEGEIYFELYQLVSKMKKLGYVPDVNCVYQDIDEIEKEKVLMSHTEKLAITYGLMKAKTNTPIRVIKNSRICSDCHNAAKYMSVIHNRDVFLKDGVRFHHFRDGKCSCNDCW